MQLLIGLGQLLANAIIKIFGSGSYPIAYKIPLTIQFIFPIVLLSGIKLCPESPWFLLRNGDIERCAEALRRLGFPDPFYTIGEMQATIEDEMDDEAVCVGHNQSQSQVSNYWKSYLDCFRGTDLRRTEIAVGAFAVSQLVGVVFVIGYSSYFFELAFYDTATTREAGLLGTSSQAFSLSIGVSVLGLVGIIASWFVINNTRIGRRGLMLWGTLVLTILLLLLGILDVIPTSSRAPVYGQSACVIAFAFVYFLTAGTTSWVIFAEIPCTRLRTKTCGLAIVVQSLFGILMNIVVPLMIK